MPVRRTVTSSDPICPVMRHSCPSHSTIRTFWTMVPLGSGSRCSGRIPTTTGWPSSTRLLVPFGTGNRLPSTSTPGDPPSAVTTPGNVFMGGVPMKWATNRFAGVSYTSRGVPTCCSRPSDRMAIRLAMVMASTWSWVT